MRWDGKRREDRRCGCEAGGCMGLIGKGGRVFVCMSVCVVWG